MSDDTEISCAFGGTTEAWKRLADMVGTDAGTLEIDGMMRHVPQYVRRERGSPFEDRGMKGIANHLVCPVAYALARHVGYDPAAILLLQTVDCHVIVDTPLWPRQIDITIGDTRDDVCGPIAAGMMWQSHPMTDAPVIRMDVGTTGLPDTILALLPRRMEGARLRDLVSNPITDAMDIGIADIDVLNWIVNLTGAPGQVTLAEAARLYERNTMGAGT